MFVKTCPNKFKILKWTTDWHVANIWTFSDKTFFFENVFKHRRLHPLSEVDNEMSLLGCTPSVKQRAWFMGFFNAGAFFIDSVFRYDCGVQNQDIDTLFYHGQKNMGFLKRNSVIAPYNTFKVRGNFLPVSKRAVIWSLKNIFFLVSKDWGH